MKDNVGMEMAQANAVVTKKFPQERMHRNPKSANKITTNTMSSLVSGVGNGSPVAGRHPAIA